MYPGEQQPLLPEPPKHGSGSACHISRSPPSYPPDWRTNASPLCGFSWPGALPIADDVIASSCCNGEQLLVWDDCFRYCVGSLGARRFGDCIHKHMHNYTEGPTMSICRDAKVSGGQSTQPGSWKAWALVASVMAAGMLQCV